jgi:hypothetical protein
MPRFANLLALLCLLSPTLAIAAQNSSCISDRLIESRDVPDDSTIIFHLRGGQVWKNALLTRCFGLKDEPDGFTFQPTDPDTEELCSNEVTIRLNSFHSTCQLGNFTRLK